MLVEQKAHIFLHRQGIKQRRLLKNHPQTLGYPVKVGSRLGWFTPPLHRTRISWCQAGQNAQNRGFTRARGANDREGFTGIHREINVIEDDLRAEALADPP